MKDSGERMNGGVETEEITTFPLNSYLLRGSRPCPTVIQYKLDAYKIQDTFVSPNYQIGSRDIMLQTGYADANADAKAEANIYANGIHTKDNMYHPLLGGHNKPAIVSCLPCQTHQF